MRAQQNICIYSKKEKNLLHLLHKYTHCPKDEQLAESHQVGEREKILLIQMRIKIQTQIHIHIQI